MRIFLRDILVTLIIAAVIFFGLRATIQSYVIWGNSMEPNFYEGQRVLLNKIIYKFHEPERGDVIILHPPTVLNSETKPFIKRVIGLPGETVEIKDDEVYINGLKLNEPYIKEEFTYTLHPQKIPENEYFVLGDNRNISNDSHTGWLVPRQSIIGKAWFTIWPPVKWGFATKYPLLEQTGTLTSNK